MMAMDWLLAPHVHRRTTAYIASNRLPVMQSSAQPSTIGIVLGKQSSKDPSESPALTLLSSGGAYAKRVPNDSSCGSRSPSNAS